MNFLDSREVIPVLVERGSSLILLDLNMPRLGGQELLEKLKPDRR